MAAPYFAGDSQAHRWIVYDHDGVQGVAYYVPEPMTDGTWNVLLIAIDPTFHGGGFGTELMRYIETELQQEGVRVVLVETSGVPEFERTRRFYDHIGYDREARIRGFYAEGDDKVIFRKALA